MNDDIVSFLKTLKICMNLSQLVLYLACLLVVIRNARQIHSLLLFVARGRSISYRVIHVTMHKTSLKL